MRLTSDISEAKQQEPIPNGWYKARVCEKKDGFSKASNAMVTLTWELFESGPFTGRQVRFDHIVIDGTDKNGERIQPIRLVEFINATGMPFTCRACGGPDRTQKITSVGDTLCCEAGHPLTDIEVETDFMLNQTCLIEVRQEKREGSSRSYPTVISYRSAV